MLAAVAGFIESDGAAAAASATSAAARAGRCHHGVDETGIAGGNGQVGLDHGRQAGSELLPGRAAIGGFEDAAAGAAERPILGESLLLLPERGVDDAWIRGIDADVVAAGVFVLEEHLFEAGAAIGGAEDAALGVGTV